MTEKSVNELKLKVHSLRETEAELDFQSRRMRSKGQERGDSRMIELSVEYSNASRAVRKLRVHQERRINLMENGDARLRKEA